jgi:hypothetical protein
MQPQKDNPMDRSFLGVVVQGIKKEATLLSSCSFLQFPRKLNESTHVLARRSELSGFARFSVAPECIREILCNDLI